MYILDRLLMYLYNIIFLENSLNNFKNKLNQMFSRKSSGLKMVLDNYNQKNRINADYVAIPKTIQINVHLNYLNTYKYFSFVLRLFL